MTGRLISLALAAEARGKAQLHLDRARVAVAAAARELEQEAAELVAGAQDALIAKSKPGEQLRMPTLEAGYAARTAQLMRSAPWRRR